MIPVVRDLIFVLGDKETVQEAKSRIPYLHYIVRPAEGKNLPVEVPEEQMQQFIAVCNEMDDRADLLSGEEAHFEVGERVEVVSGAFKGCRGSLVKIEGKRSKRFVVAIDGIIAVAVSGITANDIKHI
jgi:transcription antitermination factor NusG